MDSLGDEYDGAYEDDFEEEDYPDNYDAEELLEDYEDEDDVDGEPEDFEEAEGDEDAEDGQWRATLLLRRGDVLLMQGLFFHLDYPSTLRARRRCHGRVMLRIVVDRALDSFRKGLGG